MFREVRWIWYSFKTRGIRGVLELVNSMSTNKARVESGRLYFELSDLIDLAVVSNGHSRDTRIV